MPAGRRFLSADHVEDKEIFRFEVTVECWDGSAITEPLDVEHPLSPNLDGLDDKTADNRLKEHSKNVNDKNKYETRRKIKELRARCPPNSRLEWHDRHKICYPGGERATYYDLEFILTSNGRELARWNEWVRISGGHTHYGCAGSVDVGVPLSAALGALRTHCAEYTAFEYASPPESAGVG